MNRKHRTLGLGGLGLACPAAASVIPCAGDCGNDDRVTVDELIKGVKRIAQSV